HAGVRQACGLRPAAAHAGGCDRSADDRAHFFPRDGDHGDDGAGSRGRARLRDRRLGLPAGSRRKTRTVAASRRRTVLLAHRTRRARRAAGAGRPRLHRMPRELRALLQCEHQHRLRHRQRAHNDPDDARGHAETDEIPPRLRRDLPAALAACADRLGERRDRRTRTARPRAAPGVVLAGGRVMHHQVSSILTILLAIALPALDYGILRPRRAPSAPLAGAERLVYLLFLVTLALLAWSSLVMFAVGSDMLG